jgi:hypothetical protein
MAALIVDLDLTEATRAAEQRSERGRVLTRTTLGGRGLCDKIVVLLSQAVAERTTSAVD